MRLFLVFAVAASTSLALADAPTTTTVGPPPQAGALLDAEPAPTEAKAPSKASISITDNSIIVTRGDGELRLQLAPGSQAVIVCDSFNLASAPGEQPKLHCQNCKLTLPNGAKGTASEVVYDTAMNKLTLNGSKDQPVKLALDANGTVQSLSTSTIELELNFSARHSFPTPTPADDIFSEQPAATYPATPGAPFLTPQPSEP